MVRAPYIDKKGLKRGAWSEEEDNKLRAYILRYKAWNWNLLPKFAGLARCGKSCRMRWENYLKPGVRRGGFNKDDQQLILKMQKEHGNKWALIAKRMPGRTDNEIKNYWHTVLSNRIKQDQNSSEFVENVIERPDEEIDGVDQTKNAKEPKRIIASEPCTITTTETYFSPEESFPMASTTTTILMDASNNQLLTTTNADSLESYSDVIMAENCVYPEAIFPVTSPNAISSDGETFWNSVYEPLCVNSSNTIEAPTKCSSFTEELIIDPNESVFSTLGDFTSEPLLLDNSIGKNSSSNSTNFCPISMDFPSTSCNSRLLQTNDSWSPDDNFFASIECSLTEPFYINASNMPFLQAPELENPELLSRLDSMESFGFWNALWNYLN